MADKEVIGSPMELLFVSCIPAFIGVQNDQNYNQSRTPTILWVK